ncbi:UNVERIFIED_CONTAM: hypothetical protein K2H54_016381 [Gekko kuhli]
MDEELQNEEYQNDVLEEKFFDTSEVGSIHSKTEPEIADQEYENDNPGYEYINVFDMQMRKLPEVVTKTDSGFAECPNGWKKLDEKCYNFSSETKKWKDAQKHCQNVGADLVVIDSEREREFLDYKMNNGYWIGLFYEEDRKAWKWVHEKNEFYS